MEGEITILVNVEKAWTAGKETLNHARFLRGSHDHKNPLNFIAKIVIYLVPTYLEKNNLLIKFCSRVRNRKWQVCRSYLVHSIFPVGGGGAQGM